MEKKLEVSVIIPCYNHGEYLKEALDSIEKSTYSNIEVIVIDDGSTDDESLRHLELLKDYHVKGRPITIIYQENQGLSATRNNAIKASKGEFILPLDADDKIDPTFIEKCVWILTKYKDVSIVYPSVQHFGSKDDVWYPIPYDFQSLLRDNFMIATSMYRRKVWDDIGGYDIGLPAYEDWDFWIRAGAYGHKGYWLREPLFYYRKKENSMLVDANKRREQLVKTIREKNKKIYSSFTNNEMKEENNRYSVLWEKLALLKWKLFVFYVRIAGKVPERIKSRGRRLVKPIIRKIFKYPETGYHAPQSIEQKSFDENAENKYSYLPNIDFQKNFDISSRGVEANRRLSILFIVPWLKVGGADKVNLDLITEFTSLHHDVHLFSTLSADHVWDKKFREVCPNITHLGNWFGDNLNEILDYIIDYISTKKIDIVQMSNSQLGYEIAETIKQYCPDVKIVDLLHMEEPYYPFDYFRYSVRFKQSFDHRVVITPYLKEAMIEKYGEIDERVSVIPNGIEVVSDYYLTGYPQKCTSNNYVIGFIGRMEEQKQPLDFVRAANEIAKRIDNVSFIMIGDGSLLKQAKQLANSLAISERIEFLGSRNDAVDIMKEKIHVLLAPSLREGLPIVGLEALSLGVPVVATEVPGWIDLIFNEETGYLTPVGDYKKMAEYILELIANPEKRMEISQKAYLLAKEKYSIKKTSAKYIEIYHKLLRK